MIAGVGNDMVDLRRLRAMLARRPRLSQRLLTEEECNEFAARKDAPDYLAGRIAAKEALAKALGCGMRTPLTWQGVSVLATDGAPAFSFAEPLQEYLRTRGIGNCHLSITHDGEYAAAVVVAEFEE